MAVERVLAKLPPMEQAPKDAFWYICLEGDDGGKLMRGCACRGNSAGFVHIECLAKLAVSKEASGDRQTVFAASTKCGNCKQLFTGALGLEMARRYWRSYRVSQDLDLRYNSTTNLATCLGKYGEVDTANQLLDEESTCVGNNKAMLLELKLLRAEMLHKNGQLLEALGLLQAMLPETKVYTTNPDLYCRTMMQTVNVLLRLHRYQEAHEMATEFVAFAKPKFGLEHPQTLIAMNMYATACAMLGRVEEAKANFEYVLTTRTRILGRDHPYTQYTLRRMRIFGFAVSSAG